VILEYLHTYGVYLVLLIMGLALVVIAAKK
jgi:hypothetical protein